MTGVIRQVLELCDETARREMAAILVVMLLMALFSTVGIAAIMPFLSLVASPESVQENRWLRQVYEWLGFSSTNRFLFAVGLLTLVLLVVSNGLRALTDWKILHFVRRLQYRISRRLLAQYLSEPYSYFLNCNTSRLSQKLLSEVNSVMAGLIVPGLRGIAQFVVACFILALLVAVDPWLALFVALGLGTTYGLIFLAIRRRQLRLGREWVAANAQRYRVVSEAFGGIKDVKALGRERHFLERFERPSLEFARTVAASEAMAELPRYALEAVAFGGILVIVLYLLGSGRPVDGVLPILGLYAFAAYRLMPSLQQVFKTVSQVRFHGAALDELHRDLAALARAPVTIDAPPDEPPPLPFEREVRLRDVTFRYPEAEQPALRAVSLVLPRNRTIGLVGPTGSGKTTVVDLLLGLYLPTEGSIEVDGVPLTERTLDAWRRRVGYVPQSIFLADDTVANNIAFGIAASEVDRDAVERAARTAQIHDFILTLPQGYDTVVGERGVRLSGGQRQRIGIARALYHDPDVLVMDEATSALDTLTEDAVMEAIQRLSGRKTMVLVAHRLSTVVGCDVIYLLDRGEVVASGSYEELRGTHSMFRAMTSRAAVAG